MPIEASPKLRPHASNVPVRPQISRSWPGVLDRLHVWLRAGLCAVHGHDLQLQIERGRRVYLRCTNCGRETPGWRTR
jgi:hypothetical protein